MVGGWGAADPGPKVNAGRSFSLAQWQFIEGQLKKLPPTSANLRLTFGLHLLYGTGLRLSEAVAATVDGCSGSSTRRTHQTISPWKAGCCG